MIAVCFKAFWVHQVIKTRTHICPFVTGGHTESINTFINITIFFSNRMCWEKKQDQGLKDAEQYVRFVFSFVFRRVTICVPKATIPQRPAERCVQFSISHIRGSSGVVRGSPACQDSH